MVLFTSISKNSCFIYLARVKLRIGLGNFKGVLARVWSIAITFFFPFSIERQKLFAHRLSCGQPQPLCGSLLNDKGGQRRVPGIEVASGENLVMMSPSELSVFRGEKRNKHAQVLTVHQAPSLKKTAGISSFR